MNIYQVHDVAFKDICQSEYDMGIFASGYEDRCVFVSENINPNLIQNPALVGFSGLDTTPARIDHDKFLSARWKMQPVIMDAEGDAQIFDLLNKKFLGKSGRCKILVDYSSMSRLWYAAVLNWARFGSSFSEISIDFVYAIGRIEKERPSVVIEDMLTIPGCEGGIVGIEASVAIFGLGYNNWASLSVLERLESDRVYAYLASPGSTDDFAALVLERNRDFLAEPRVSRSLLNFPLRSVEMSYRYLSEVIVPHHSSAIVTLVPMGPKPHVLAAILAAMRFPGVCCLRISTKLSGPEKVTPTGEVVATRVIIRAE